MLRFVAWLTFAVAVLIAGTDSARAAETKVVPDTRQEIEFSYAPLVKRTAPAVVNIYARTVVRQQASPLFEDPIFRRFFGQGFPFQGVPRERVQNSLGSGVVVDPDGLIVTNHHVIADADQITVALPDRREFPAKVVSNDERIDLAVLRIDTKGEKLPSLVLGDSDELEVGDLVLAVGNPFGVGQTVTSGIVSALARTKIGVSDYRFFIQTDAAINPGNSGGALIDMKGDLVGINTALYSESGGSQGIGFAIPSNMVRAVVRAAVSGTPVTHPWLGVSTQAVTAEAAKALNLDRPKGVLVKAIHRLSPAAGSLVPGDVVLAVNGHEIDDPEALKFRIATLTAGDTATLDVLHEGQPRAVKVTPVTPPERPKRDVRQITGANPFAGATVANLSPALADELGVDDMLTGVIVTEVGQSTNAANLEFQPGDLILRINDQPVDSVAGLTEILGQAADAWQIAINRGGRVLNLTVRR